MESLTRQNTKNAQYPTRALQFGEGNFLRAFIDWQLDLLNENAGLNCGVAIVRPIDTDFPPSLNVQDGLYTTVIRGLNEQGEAEESTRLISSVNEEVSVYREFDRYLELAKNPDLKFIFSNTTEAGIAFSEETYQEDKAAHTFPGKLTQWLYARYKHFDGDMSKGLYIIPCELIDYNGDKLKQTLLSYAELWQLGQDFTSWLEGANTYCSTLVDRIVTGHPRDELESLEQKLGYRDQFMVTAEHFYLLVIQGPSELAEELKLADYPVNVKIVDDIAPYKERKVAILNGAHTALVPVAYMSGIDTVGQAMADKDVETFVCRLLQEEIIPALSLPEDELRAFADSVIQRFKNPYIKHQLTDIALNSMTKWKTRLLPQLLARTEATGSAPNLMALSLAAQLLFYRGIRDDKPISLKDDEHWLKMFTDLWREYAANNIEVSELVKTVLKERSHWGADLTELPGLAESVSKYLLIMLENDSRMALQTALHGR